MLSALRSRKYGAPAAAAFGLFGAAVYAYSRIGAGSCTAAPAVPHNRSVGELAAAVHLSAPVPVINGVVASVASTHHQLESQVDYIYDKKDAPLVAKHLSSWWTSQLIDRLFYQIKDGLNVPWWAAITTGTLALRFALMPIQLGLLKNSLRMKILTPEIANLEAVLAAKVGSGGIAGGVTGASTTAAVTNEMKVAAAHKLKSLFKTTAASPWAQTVIFPFLMPGMILSVFGAVHDLCMAEPGMTSGGALWFPDLVAQDSTYLLPIVSALTWLWNVEMGESMLMMMMALMMILA